MKLKKFQTVWFAGPHLDDEYYFMGRENAMCKYSGTMLFLDEILEKALERHPFVVDDPFEAVELSIFLPKVLRERKELIMGEIGRDRRPIYGVPYIRFLTSVAPEEISAISRRIDRLKFSMKIMIDTLQILDEESRWNNSTIFALREYCNTIIDTVDGPDLPLADMPSDIVHERINTQRKWPKTEGKGKPSRVYKVSFAELSFAKRHRIFD